MNAKKVLIIGCGNIAGKYNNHTDSSKSLTHAKAILQNPNLELYGCVDNDKENLKSFSKKWNIPRIFNSIDEVKNKNQIDIITIASPTDLHFEHLRNSLNLNPRVVFLEKPASIELTEINKLKDLNLKNNIAVNYLRAWDEKLHEMKGFIHSKESKILNIHAICSGDILNYGSHMIHCLQMLFGELKIENIFSDGLHQKNVVFSSDYKNMINVIFNNSFNFYSVFEINFFLEDKIITMRNNGLVWESRSITSDKHFKNLKYGNVNAKFESGGLLEALDNAYKNIIENIDKKATLNCTLDNALDAEVICHKIISYRNKK